MDIQTRKLDIFTKKMVKGRCNIKNFHNLSDEFELSVCQKCPFLIDDELCQWYKYNTSIKKSSSETDDDDFGGLPSTLYEWIIECANCGNDVRFTSGYSHLSCGDNSKCRKCKLQHYFLTHGKEHKEKIFAIPIKEYDKLKRKYVGEKIK